MEPVAGLLVAVAFGLICSRDWEDAGGFLATFSVALSMIVIAYVLLYFLTL